MAVAQAVQALNACFQVGNKRQKKGMSIWPGIKRVAVEIPIADQSPAAQLELAQALLASLPPAAGLPVVMFGDQACTDLARDRDVPFEVHSVLECVLDEEEGDFKGPLLLFSPTEDQAAACQHIVDNLWTGRALIVANAAWYRAAVPSEVAPLAESLDPVYFFLPVAFSGLLGGQSCFLFRWSQSSAGSKWRFFKEERGDMVVIGQMASKPTQADFETMVYNASAAKSPLTAGAKALGKLTKRFRR